MRITRAKILSLLVASGYIAIFLLFVPGESFGYVFRLFAWLLLPLGFIWFPSEFGNYTGYFGRGNYIDEKTPAVIVSGMGWFFLIGFPLMLYLAFKYG